MEERPSIVGTALMLCAALTSGVWAAGPEDAAMPASPAVEVPQNEAAPFVGHWRVVDRQNQPFYLQLRDDFTVGTRSVSGADLGPGMQGTWRTEEGRAVVLYVSGQVDVLVLRGAHATRRSYPALHALDQRPDSISPAIRVADKAMKSAIEANPRLMLTRDAYVLSEKSF